jgi:peptidoglycan/LPS O-acetylase OafA/YrhL
VQKAFPKVLGWALGVVAYAVVLVAAIIGDGYASNKGWAIVVAVPLAALIAFLLSRRRRTSRDKGSSRDSPSERPPE